MRLLPSLLLYITFAVSTWVTVPNALAYPVFDWSEATELHDGVLWAHTTTTVPRNLSINVLRVDSQAARIRFHSTGRIDGWIENERETQRETTQNFLRNSRASGMNMIAAINADAWTPFPAPETTPANLSGLAISSGTLVSPASSSPSLLVSEIGQLSLATTMPSTDVSQVNTAVSGFQFALANGIPVSSGADLQPRTGYGLSENRRLLYLMTIDGRRFSSQGATVSEVGQWLAFFGADDGLNMDGGGSTTLAWWNPALNDAELLNVPNGLQTFNPNLSSEQNLLNEQLFFNFGVLPNERANGNNFGIYFAPVPEPSSLSLAILAIVLLCRYRRPAN